MSSTIATSLASSSTLATGITAQTIAAGADYSSSSFSPTAMSAALLDLAIDYSFATTVATGTLTINACQYMNGRWDSGIPSSNGGTASPTALPDVLVGALPIPAVTTTQSTHKNDISLDPYPTTLVIHNGTGNTVTITVAAFVKGLAQSISSP